APAEDCRSRLGFGRRLPGMPDLFEQTNPGGRDRALTLASDTMKKHTETQTHEDGESEAAVTVAGRVPMPVSPTPEAAPLLLFQHVSKWYGPVIGVNQVTLELRAGITGLVGSNGAGKSTLMRLVTGQQRPDLGVVQVFGHDAWSAEAKRHMGYCSDVDAFYEEMSGRQFVETMMRLCGYPRQEARRRTEEVLELVDMAGRAERRLRGYSKGMRQRIKLAAALVHDPELLILDEPLSGIDPIGRQEF